MERCSALVRIAEFLTSLEQLCLRLASSSLYEKLIQGAVRNHIFTSIPREFRWRHLIQRCNFDLCLPRGIVGMFANIKQLQIVDFKKVAFLTLCSNLQTLTMVGGNTQYSKFPQSLKQLTYYDCRNIPIPPLLEHLTCVQNICDLQSLPESLLILHARGISDNGVLPSNLTSLTLKIAPKTWPILPQSLDFLEIVVDDQIPTLPNSLRIVSIFVTKFSKVNLHLVLPETLTDFSLRNFGASVTVQQLPANLKVLRWESQNLPQLPPNLEILHYSTQHELKDGLCFEIKLPSKVRKANFKCNDVPMLPLPACLDKLRIRTNVSVVWPRSDQVFRRPDLYEHRRFFDQS